MTTLSKKIVSLGLIIVAALLHLTGPSFLNSIGISSNSTYHSIALIGFEVFLWAAVTLVICILVRAIIWDGIVKRASGWSTPSLIKSLSDIIIIVTAALFAANKIFDQNIIAFITALGAVGVVLSFGIKELISDLMTGLAINLEHSFSIGDWVSINDGQAGSIFGRVTQIHWRTTHLIDENQSYFVVPNREIGNSTITIYSSPTKIYRFSVPVELDYPVDVEDAKRILLSAALAVTNNDTFVQNPAPSVIVSRFPASGVEYQVRFWLDMSGDVLVTNAKGIIMESILHHLRLEGLSPAYSKLEHFRVAPPDMLAVSPPIDKVKMMSRLPFLAPLNDSERAYIAEHSSEAIWSPKQTIIKSGESGESMFVVLQGVLDVLIDNKQNIATRVGQIQVGEIFGEMSLLTGAPRSATIVAKSSVKTLEITKDVFSKLLSERPELGKKLSEIMSKRQLLSQSALSEEEREAEHKRASTLVYSKIKAFFGTGS